MGIFSSAASPSDLCYADLSAQRYGKDHSCSDLHQLTNRYQCQSQRLNYPAVFPIAFLDQAATTLWGFYGCGAAIKKAHAGMIDAPAASLPLPLVPLCGLRRDSTRTVAVYLGSAAARSNGDDSRPGWPAAETGLVSSQWCFPGRTTSGKH